MGATFERGVMVVSIDTEQIWGYRDFLTEAQFEERFPGAPGAHPKLLARFCAAGASATWFVVGGLALPNDGLSATREQGGPLWRCRPFLERLRDAWPAQEIGIHGGLTHMVWTDPRSTREAAHGELTDGIAALGNLGVRPRSFSYPRNMEAYHDLLPACGLQCFRGAPPTLSWHLGRSFSGAILRITDELRRATPPVVWPSEILPGLWTIPASMFLYPLAPGRARWIGLRSRVERFRRGLEAAARHRGIFHFCFHPENLVESPQGFALLDDLLESLVRSRERGDIEVLTISDVMSRMERTLPYGLQRQQQHAHLLEAHWRQ